MIASISGVALLSPLTYHQVVAVSIAYKPAELSDPMGALSKAQGSECPFVNASNLQDVDADIEILGCEAHETCVEDMASCVGG